MNEEQLKLLVVAGREALATALRQWNYHATESRALDGHPVLGTTDEVESRIYNDGIKTLKRLGAAADEIEDAPLARKTAFDSSAWVAEWEAALRHEEKLVKLHAASGGSSYLQAHYRRKCLIEVLESVRRHSTTE